jgi:hypothetical protein
MDDEATETRTLAQRVDDSALEYAWVSASGRRAIAFDEGRIGLFEPGVTRVEPWENVKALAPTRDRVSVELKDGTQFEFAFANKSDGAQFPRLLPKGWEAKASSASPASADTVPHVGGTAAVRKDLVPRSTASDARDALRSLFGFGLVGQFIGGIVLGAALANGTGLGLFVAWVPIAAGSMTTFVALVGFGVKLGVQAADTRK